MVMCLFLSSMQYTYARLAGMVWGLENQESGKEPQENLLKFAPRIVLGHHAENLSFSPSPSHTQRQQKWPTLVAPMY